MPYQLVTETKNESGKRKRVYRNDKTGGESETEEIYTDKLGNVWFGFVDLFKIPYIRIAFSQNISNLFSVGCSKQDMVNWCNSLKSILRNDKDIERYEKAYREILNIEVLIENTADPVKQHLGLCTVYVLKEDERIDYFNEAESFAKLKIWRDDLDAQAFFLNWHMQHIQHLSEVWKGISETASTIKQAVKDIRGTVHPQS